MAARGERRLYASAMPRSWVYSMAILILALMASMVIAVIKLI